MMFTSISTMMELETEETAGDERRELLAVMADVRGFLGNARVKFRNAALLTQPNRRTEFEQAWNELEFRWTRLTDRQDQLTDGQREPLEKFNQAREAFRTSAEDMFRTIYPAEHADNEVLP